MKVDEGLDREMAAEMVMVAAAYGVTTEREREREILC